MTNLILNIYISCPAAVQSLLPYRGAVVASPDSTYSVTLYAPKEITDRATATVSASRVLNFGLTGDKPAENETVSQYNYTIRYRKKLQTQSTVLILYEKSQCLSLSHHHTCPWHQCIHCLYAY